MCYKCAVSVPREQRRQHGAAGRALLLRAGGGHGDQPVQPLPARLPHVRVQSGQVPQPGQTIDNSQWKRSLEFEETNCKCNLDTFWKDDNIW